MSKHWIGSAPPSRSWSSFPERVISSRSRANWKTSPDWRRSGSRVTLTSPARRRPIEPREEVVAVVRPGRFKESEPAATDRKLDAVRSLSRPLYLPEDLDPMLEHIGEAHYVLLGEASHGTHEYYTWRAALSRRLITEKGFSFI